MTCSILCNLFSTSGVCFSPKSYKYWPFRIGVENALAKCGKICIFCYALICALAFNFRRYKAKTDSAGTFQLMRLKRSVTFDGKYIHGKFDQKVPFMRGCENSQQTEIRKRYMIEVGSS